MSYIPTTPYNILEKYIPEQYKDMCTETFESFKSKYTWNVEYETKKMGITRRIDEVFTYDDAMKKTLKYDVARIFFKCGNYPIFSHDSKHGDEFYPITGLSFVNHDIEYFIHPLEITGDSFYLDGGDNLLHFTVRSSLDEIEEQIIGSLKNHSHTYIKDEVRQYYELCTKKYCRTFADYYNDFVYSISYHGEVRKITDPNRLYMMDGPIIKNHDFVRFQDTLLQLDLDTKGYNYRDTKLNCIEIKDDERIKETSEE